MSHINSNDEIPVFPGAMIEKSMSGFEKYGGGQAIGRVGARLNYKL
jgi:hypothetical protein